MALVGESSMVFHKDGIDDCPGGFNRIFTGEERTIASHGVAQKPLIRCFLPRLFFGQVEFALVADELFSCALHAGGEGDAGTWRDLESQIVGAASRWRRVSEESLWGR